MPAYSNPGPQEDMYSDAEGSPAEEARETPEEESEEQEKAPEAEIPKSLLAGKDFKPGEEIVLEIVAVGEESVRVKYASEKGDYEEEEPEAGRGTMRGPGGPPPDEMAGMME